MASASTWRTERGVFAALVDATHIGITATDATGTILALNATALAPTNLSCNPLWRQPFKAFAWPPHER